MSAAMIEDEAPIDAVITWVDGNDPAHRARLDKLLAATGGARPPTARATRFNDAGEIDYCVASILRHAPWFRRIHIVVDRQVPALMATLAGTPLADRVRLVDHREIFAGFERHLPTFNSRAIITALWRIPELAERFVYFNDDFMLLRPVRASDFFRDGKVVLRGTWLTQAAQRWTRRLLVALKALRGGVRVDRAGNHDAQEASARLAGFDRRYYRLYHNPYPMRRSTLGRFFDANPELLDANLGHRLRSSAQFKTESLATHLEIAQGHALLDNALETVQIKPRSQSRARIARKLARAQRDPRAAFVCVQSLELASEDVQVSLRAWLAAHAGRLDEIVAGSAAHP